MTDDEDIWQEYEAREETHAIEKLAESYPSNETFPSQL